MHLIATLALASIVAAAPLAAAPSGAPRVVVYTFNTTGVPDTVGSSLSEVVATQVARSGKYDVLTWANIMNLMKLEEVKQALGTDDPKVIIKLSEKFNAAYIVTGTVNQLGSAYVVTLQLVNVAAQKVDRRLSQTLYGDAAQISASLRTASQALVSEISPDKAQSMSEKAFDAVIRSETPKHLNVRLSGGVRIPLGASQSDVGLYFVRAPQYLVNLDAGWMVTQWLETGLSLSMGIADGAEAFQGVLAVSDATTDPVSGNAKTTNSVTVLNLKPKFAVRDISAAVQAKVRPPEGIFLPYASLKLGAAMDRREVRSETVSAAFPGVGGTACPGYATYDAASGACLLDLGMAPKNDPAWRTGFLGGVGVGLDLLVWRHVALTAQLGYELRIFGGEEDFDLTTQKAYTGDPMTGVQPGNAQFLDRYKLPSMEQSFTATLGAMGYF